MTNALLPPTANRSRSTENAQSGTERNKTNAKNGDACNSPRQNGYLIEKRITPHSEHKKYKTEAGDRATNAKTNPTALASRIHTPTILLGHTRFFVFRCYDIKCQARFCASHFRYCTHIKSATRPRVQPSYDPAYQTKNYPDSSKQACKP